MWSMGLKVWVRVINTELRLAVISGEREQGMGRGTQNVLVSFSYFFSKIKWNHNGNTWRFLWAQMSSIYHYLEHSVFTGRSIVVKDSRLMPLDRRDVGYIVSKAALLGGGAWVKLEPWCLREVQEEGKKGETRDEEPESKHQGTCG